MQITIETDLTELSWTDFIAAKLFVECAPLRAIKNRRMLLTKFELEYRRREDESLIPKDLPEELLF